MPIEPILQTKTIKVICYAPRRFYVYRIGTSTVLADIYFSDTWYVFEASADTPISHSELTDILFFMDSLKQWRKE